MAAPYPSFPASPTIGQTYTDANGAVWTFGNIGWTKTLVSLTSDPSIWQDIDSALSYDSSGNVTITGGLTAGGKVSIPLGTAPLPSLYFGTDTNTGIYSPGADQIGIATNGTSRVVVDASGNLGLGVVPSAWKSSYKGFDIGTGGLSTAASIGLTQLTSNAYYNTSNQWIYKVADFATYYQQYSGQHQWYTAPSGTAGAAITFTQAMTLDASGRLGIGATSPQSALDIASGAYQSVRTYLSSITDTYHQFRGTPDGVGYEHARVFSGRDTSVHTYGSYLAFYTEGKASGTTDTSVERARIDSSGRLLVGTTTSRSTAINDPQLQIEGTGFSSSSMQLICNNNATAIASPHLAFGRTRGTAVGGTTAVVDGDRLGTISFNGAQNNSLSSIAALIDCYVDGEVQTAGDTTDMPGRLVFSTTADGEASPTERMRITNDGNILIGTTNTATGARIYCPTTSNAPSVYAECTNTNLSSSVIVVVAARNTTNGSYKAIEYYNSGATATRFFVSDNGDTRNTNGVFGAISDVKLKENIVDANSQWSDIKSIRVRNYNLKSDQTHRQIGVVAQEIEQISPGLVVDIPDHDREGNDLGTVTKSVNYSVLYMKAVKALQEAMERIEKLEADVAALKA